MSEPALSLDAAQQRITENANANRVTKKSIESKIAGVAYIRPKTDTPGDELNTTTICIISMQNGWKSVGKSGCVDPANFDLEVGKRYAYEDAFKPLWALEGYVLATDRYLRGV